MGVKGRPKRVRMLAVPLGMAVVIFALGPSTASAQPLTCGQTIAKDTTLHADLGPCPGDGLVIGADNVTLDLNGHAIIGDDTDQDVGVLDEGHDGAVVKNGEIHGFFTGVKLDAADRSGVSDITASASPNAGFDVSGSYNSIENNVADPAPDSPFHISGSHNVIRHNVTSGSYDGMRIEGSLNRVTHNRVEYANGGLWIRGRRNLVQGNSVSFDDSGLPVSGPGNVIRNNVVVSNPGRLEVSDCRNVRVEANLLVRDGMTLSGCQNARVAHNAVSSFESSGILLDGGSDNTITENTVSGTYDSGIIVRGGSLRTAVKDNLARRAGISRYGTENPESDGIQVEDPGTAIADNRANRNADYGIQAVPGVIDGGGNTASGNGNPLQCLNVVCN
jgi:parallel beta-helix repeat protein